MSKRIFIVCFWHQDEGDISECTMQAFFSFASALEFARKMMKKKWAGSDEAYGKPASERDHWLQEALEELTEGKRANVSDHMWMIKEIACEQ